MNLISGEWKSIKEGSTKNFIYILYIYIKKKSVKMWSSWRTKTVFNKENRICQCEHFYCTKTWSWAYCGRPYVDLQIKTKMEFSLLWFSVKTFPCTDRIQYWHCLQVRIEDDLRRGKKSKAGLSLGAVDIMQWFLFLLTEKNLHLVSHANIVPGAQVVWLTNRMTWKLWDRLRPNTLSLLWSGQPPCPPPVHCSTVTLTEAWNTSQRRCSVIRSKSNYFLMICPCIQGHRWTDYRLLRLDAAKSPI